jgi:glycosyltransferase involved in cell wall biosynthesis
MERAFQDFLGAFTNGLPKAVPAATTGKRILIFNWRDLTHAYAGGAEVYVHEVAKEWVRLGHHVTLFAGNDGKQKRHETIDGVKIIRRGGFFLVYVWAALYYVLRLRGKYDVIVDCENGIPFFTPIFVRKPVFCLMHHVHQDVFFHSLPRPLAWFASFLEKTIMPLVYRKVKFITVSQSSKEEMEEHEIGQAGIFVVHPGINQSEFSHILYEKTTMPTILYLGRLKAYKSINVLIQAFRIILSERPDARLVIAGSGDEEDHLKRLARELRLTAEQIQFVGQVSQIEKVKLLQSSWVLVNPSFMEGWGIVAIEANASGTPVIASNVPGLRDSVQHGRAGYLLPYGDVAAFSESILTIIRNRELRLNMEQNAKVWAGNFSWQKSGAEFLSVITHH